MYGSNKKVKLQNLNVAPEDYYKIYFVGFWEIPARRCTAKKKDAWYANYFINMQKIFYHFCRNRGNNGSHK